MDLKSDKAQSLTKKQVIEELKSYLDDGDVFLSKELPSIEIIV